MAALDNIPIGDWAAWYRKNDLKALRQKTGAKCANVPWLPYQTQAPTEDEHARWFAKGTEGGVVLVLDNSGVVVLDCDGERQPARQLLETAGIKIPHACPRVITGRDRDHFYFRTERPVGRHVGLLKSDDVTIDVLGTGLAMAPPSIHPDTGRPYRWSPPFLERAQIPLLPTRVHDLIADATRPTQPTLTPVNGPIPKGERERTLTSMLGAARRRGAQEPELRALAEAANQRCVPSLSGRDLDRLAHSISRYEPDTLNLDELLASVETKTEEPVALEFVTPAELRAHGAARVDYVLRPYLIAGTLADLTGAAKIGKTRFRNHLIYSAVTGSECLGFPATTPTRVVLLTEEPPASLLEGLEAAGLTDTSDVAILTRYAARSADWPAIVAAAVAKAREIEARLLIVDTLPGLARLQGDSENSAGHALAALQPLQEADVPGLAKLVIRHTRKSGGELVEAGRGSSAFAGEADVLVCMTKPRGSRPSVRRLEAIGRFEAIPSELLIERVSDGLFHSSTPTDPPLPESIIETYRVIDADEAADPEAATVSDRVVQALPRTADEAMTVSVLAKVLDATERTARHGLDQLADRVKRLGTGKRGDPHKFFIPALRDLYGVDEWNKPETTGKEDTHMASRSNDRAPPTHDRVHDNAGAGTPAQQLIDNN